MRILILASTFPRWSGDNTPDFVLNFAKTLSNKHQVYVVAPHDKGASFHETISGVEIYRFPYFMPRLQRLVYRGGMVNTLRESTLAKIQFPFFLLAQTGWGLYVGHKKKIEIINAHWLIPQGLIAVLLKPVLRKPIIITTHGGDIAILRHKFFARLIKPIVKKADAVSFVSSIARENALKSLEIKNFKKHAVMPMGVELPNPRGIKEHKEPEILFMGRLVAIKGVDVLLNAFALIHDKYPKTILRIAGDGPMLETWKRLSDKLNIQKSVVFEGYVTGKYKHQLLSDTDIVVVPSIRDEHGYEEGLPVSALEALAYGKSLIATNTGSLPSLLNNRNGMLVRPQNARELAKALDSVMADADLRKQLGEAGMKTAKKYSWDNVAQIFENITRSVYG